MNELELLKRQVRTLRAAFVVFLCVFCIAATFPILNGKLQGALDANSQDITSVGNLTGDTATFNGILTVGNGSATEEIQLAAQFTTGIIRMNGVSSTITLVNLSEFQTDCQVDLGGNELKNASFLELDNLGGSAGLASHDILFSNGGVLYRNWNNGTPEKIITDAQIDTFAELDALVADKSLANLNDGGNFSANVTFGNGIGTSALTLGDNSSATFTLTWDGNSGDGTLAFDSTSLTHTFGNQMTVNGEARLGDASSDNHGINTAPVANQMITEDFDTALTSGSEYGRKQTIDHTGNTAIVGTVNRYGYYLDQNSSGTHNQSFSQTLIYGHYIDSTDTSILNDSDSSMSHVGLYVNANGAATSTMVGAYTRTALSAINQSNVAGATKTAGHFSTSGTSANAYGLRADASGGTTGNYALWLGNGATAGGGQAVFAEDEPFYFGQANDAFVKYDGADFILDPDVSGSGKVLIGATGDNYIQAARVYLNATDYLYTDGTSLLWSDN